MIILEFRFSAGFQAACELLGDCRVPFLCESALDPWGSNLIYFFEEDVRTGAQAEALGQARNLERADRSEREGHHLPNLAIPL